MPCGPTRRALFRRTIPRRASLLALSAAAALALLVLAAPPAARPWGSFRGVAGLKVTDTHQQIFNAAFLLFINDPRIKGLTGVPISGGRLVWVDYFLEQEGVNGSILTFRPYGPGPDADGSTLYSCHWFNPMTGRGAAPQSAGDWYSRFIRAILGIAGTDEDAFKGLAWASHFVADMFVPYHTIGIPAEEAEARIASGKFILTEAEAGPAFLMQPEPPGPVGTIPGTVIGDLAIAYDRWKRDGWGYNMNFRESLKIFADNRGAAAVPNEVNFVDWFDPWYWNGMLARTIVYGPFLSNPDIDPGKSTFSSHAAYESRAHARFLKTGGYKSATTGQPRYDPLWKNAPPDYAFSGNAWQAQSWQVQDFAAKIALRTRQNMEVYWKTPEIPVRGAVEAVYTLMRSAYCALKPMIQVRRDPARPNDGLVITATIGNVAWESCHDVSVRLRLGKGGTTVVENVQMLTQPIAGPGSGTQTWIAQVNPDEEWTVTIEAVGVFDKTPDLQYNMAYAQYRPDPSQRGPVKRVEEAAAADFIGSYVHTDPLRTYEQYHGEMDLRADGTYTDVETFSSGSNVVNSHGVWTYEPGTMTISIRCQDGGQFSGSVRGNTADFTINGTWANGASGTLRFQRR
jgi:hypothetical protein